MRIFLKRSIVERNFALLPRHISSLLVLVFLFALIVSIGSSVFFSPTSAEAQGSEKGVLHSHHALVQEAIGVHHRHHNWLMRIPDVVGTGVGIGPDGLPVIKVFTSRHGVKGIPEWLESTPVHTEVTGRFYALRGKTCDVVNPPTLDGICTVAERWPLPVPTGVSVGHPAITAGTIAARVTDGTNVFILSNNHVLANINQATLGDPILQPGAYDGGTLDDAIANLTEYEQIKFCTVFWIWIICDETNTMDAAIALSDVSKLGVSTPVGQFGSVAGYGAPSSTIHPAYGNRGTIGDENLTSLLGIAVQKYGRGTGLTTGSINTINATVDVCYDADCVNIARFTDQLIAGPGNFSAGGDSGSLVVDSQRRPVGLLFAGSDTQTIVNRIDLVLNRFGVTIDEGAVVEPTIDTDVAITAIDVHSTPVVVNKPVTVTVTVENRGQAAVTDVIVKLDDLTEGGTVETASVTTDLGLGESKSLEFLWMPTKGGSHTLEASHQFADDNSGNDTYTEDVNVLLPPGGPQLQLWKGLVYTNQWTTVPLGYEYGDEMVVVCSPNYDLSAPGPAIARVRNARGSSFEVGLGRPWYGTFGGEDFSANVYCMVVREGFYTKGEDGVNMEAVKLANFTSTDHAGSWSGQRQIYQNVYTRPVVVGQVMSPNTENPPSYCPGLICEPDWSVFWSRGTAVTNPPSSSTLYVGRHTGEDKTGRDPETLMYVVIESGTGTIEGLKYVAALGADTVRGMQNRPPFNYSLSGLASASAAIVSQAGMDATDGGWAVLYGPSAVSATRLRLAIDEDWYLHSERNHTTEQVSYIVFE
jgi:hypothetical protein